MVTLQILVLSFLVRVRVPQQTKGVSRQLDTLFVFSVLEHEASLNGLNVILKEHELH